MSNIVGFAVLALLLAGCSEDSTGNAPPVRSSSPELPASNQRMARRLRAFAESPDSELLRYLNDLQVERLRPQVTQMPPEVFPHLHHQLAVQLLRAGRTAEAIERFGQIAAALKKDNPPLHFKIQPALERLRGIAYLRLGEQANCLQNHTTDSCVVPIARKGIHTLPEGSRGAIEIFTKLLWRDPENLDLQWLLNIAHMTLGEYPQKVPQPFLVPPAVFASDLDVPRFPDVAPSLDLDVVGLSGGTIMEDFNGDGFLDIMVSSWDPRDQMRYFQSNGDGTFSDRTTEALLTGQTGGLNLTHADYDNDGDADVLVLRGAWLSGPAGEQPNSLLRNRGDGSFEDVTEQAGLLSFHPTQTAAWGDFNNDGALDVFIGNESSQNIHPCELYRNNGDGTFTNVAAEVGLDHIGFVKAAAWGDIDNDGRLDLFLSRANQPNLLFRNSGRRFLDVTRKAGVAEPVSSFPAWFFDYDNDGWEDLLVASFPDFFGSALTSVVRDALGLPGDGERCRLYRNRGDGTFEDVTEQTGFDRRLLAMGANFGDLDNDGYLDCFFGTGEPALSTLVPNVMLRNDGGRGFQDVTTSGGFGNVQRGHGVAFGDIDNDGDQDIYIVMGGAYSGDVYQNTLHENPGFGNHWITMQFRGVRSNRGGLGARVRVVVEAADGTSKTFHRRVGAGGSFGSSSLQLEVGLGPCRRIIRVEVFWPVTGKTDVFETVPLDRIVRIREGAGEVQSLELPRIHLAGSSGDAARKPNPH